MAAGRDPIYNCHLAIHAIDSMTIELNPIRQRIADLRGRLDALRGYL
jgi:hypothetical protein